MGAEPQQAPTRLTDVVATCQSSKLVSSVRTRREALDGGVTVTRWSHKPEAPGSTPGCPTNWRAQVVSVGLQNRTARVRIPPPLPMLYRLTAGRLALNQVVEVRILVEQLWRVARGGPQPVSKTGPVVRLRVRLLHFPLWKMWPVGATSPAKGGRCHSRWFDSTFFRLGCPALVRQGGCKPLVRMGMVGSTPTALTVLDHLEWGEAATLAIRFESGRASGPVKVTGWSCKPAQEGSIPSGSTGL